MSPKEYVSVLAGLADDDEVQGYKCRPVHISSLDQPRANLVPRFNKGQFMDSVLRVNSFKLAPSHYQPKNLSAFNADTNRIHFAYNRAERTTFFAETAKKTSWVPGPNAYKPDGKDKIKGNQK